MAMLFRPWVLSDTPDQNQDDTVSTTVDVKEEDGVRQAEDVPRHVRYKCVKEHVRERSEKKTRRLRQTSEKISSDVRVSGAHNLEPVGLFPLAHVPCPPNVIQTPFFPPTIDPYSTAIVEFLNDTSKDCWDELSATSPELVEAALAQGIPAAMLEEYVRVMTEQQRQIAERNRKQRPKKFRCPHCQVGFSNNGQLKGHIRIHTGERPFKCEAEHCGKSFTRNEELTRHRRIHSGLRPFPCPDCGKRFGRKDHLKKHIRTHYQQRYQLLPILSSHYPYLLGL